MNGKTVALWLAMVAFGHFMSGQAADETPEKSPPRRVLPSVTDGRIDKYSGDGYEHWIYFNPSVTARGQMLVFIPGTGGKGNGARAFCALAADEGFHVVSLAYPSDVSMSAFHDSSDPDCFLKARENVIYGKAPYMRLTTTEANSIHNRMLKLAQYLAQKFPNEGWGQFVTVDGALNWNKLVLSGQSQGGGHAALMAMQHEVTRVLMFGAPKDFNIHFNKPAPWFSGPSATPLDRFFSFVHSADEGHGCTYVQQLENYRAMELSPKYPVINVDDASAPYQNSRLLTSKRRQENPHGAVIADKDYLNVWKYMLNESVR